MLLKAVGKIPIQPPNQAQKIATTQPQNRKTPCNLEVFNLNIHSIEKSAESLLEILVSDIPLKKATSWERPCAWVLLQAFAQGLLTKGPSHMSQTRALAVTIC